MLNTKVNLVLEANSATAIFGTATEEAEIRRIYKKFARRIHPDMFDAQEDKKLAEKAFVKLNAYQEAILNAHPTAKAGSSSTVKSRKHEYTLGSKIKSDDVFDYYEVTYDAGYEEALLLITRDPKDFDLAEAYSSNLKAVRSSTEEYKFFYPNLLDNFRWRQDGSDRAAIVLEKVKGFYTLTEVKDKYTQGLHGRDIGWMFKRVLVAVGVANDAGVVHGAPTTDNIVIHPDFHGLQLNGWQYSVKDGSSLKAVPASNRKLYPESALDKKPVNYSLDIALAAKTMLSLCGPATPKQFAAFFKGCLVANPPQAPELLHEFDELLLALYGAPKFHPFTME